MTKLNEIRDNEGAHTERLRVGPGPGSGKGKTAGRGVKGQKSRSGVALRGFEGGQMPLHMRMPKRGFNNPFAKDFAEVNLWRLTQAIEAGKLDIKTAIDGKALVAAGVIRRERDGVRLLGKGELKSKIDITVYSASASAVKAVEAAGGKVTTTAKPKAEAEPAAEAEAKPKGKAKAKGKA
ncbi:MAG: rplO [Caulobacteraceae bacterium]|nr:rplO [Caulobacteraceae bacterium]